MRCWRVFYVQAQRGAQYLNKYLWIQKEETITCLSSKQKVSFLPFCQHTLSEFENSMNPRAWEAKAVLDSLQTNFPMSTKQLRIKVLILSYIPLLLLGWRLYHLYILNIAKPSLGFWWDASSQHPCEDHKCSHTQPASGKIEQLAKSCAKCL